ncbi:unnamed protein product [Protopolystoma xenopodis]|uniref:Uncharacterized protein n=1 Tax=Protopolystoma xenopodis TaxID=117903 RepID=A0A3S5AME4_9PLAT|nr:unnamed protein product [Protopolystoma xenopodis]
MRSVLCRDHTALGDNFPSTHHLPVAISQLPPDTFVLLQRLCLQSPVSSCILCLLPRISSPYRLGHRLFGRFPFDLPYGSLSQPTRDPRQHALVLCREDETSATRHGVTTKWRPYDSALFSYRDGHFVGKLADKPDHCTFIRREPIAKVPNLL